MFKRKKWKYLILDEAHMIKNWKSQRWQVRSGRCREAGAGEGTAGRGCTDECKPAGNGATYLAPKTARLYGSACQLSGLMPCSKHVPLPQTLLNFNSKRRLLITGTPLQNGAADALLATQAHHEPAACCVSAMLLCATPRPTVFRSACILCAACAFTTLALADRGCALSFSLPADLMELWSLMHFLMPQVFGSHAQFKDWFSNPLTGMVEGSAEVSPPADMTSAPLGLLCSAAGTHRLPCILQLAHAIQPTPGPASPAVSLAVTIDLACLSPPPCHPAPHR